MRCASSVAAGPPMASLAVRMPMTIHDSKPRRTRSTAKLIGRMCLRNRRGFRIALIAREGTEQLRKLGNVGCDAPRLVFGQPLHGHAPPWLIFKIEIGQRLPRCIRD